MSKGDNFAAGLPYRGATSRSRVRRPRFDRDGRFLFRWRHASESLKVIVDG